MSARPIRTEPRAARAATAWRAWRAFAAVLLAAWCGLCDASVPGLAGSFYNNTSLSGSPVLTRTDATIAFNWGLGSPGPGVNSDNFSIRWTGAVRVATTGSYNFQTVSDDGVRLYVNGVLVINNWTTHSTATDNSAAISLTAGVVYSITLEYFEVSDYTTMQLNWKKPGDSSYGTIPADNGTLGLNNGSTLVAEYNFEERVWNGTAGELRDTAGYGTGPYNGRAQGSPMPSFGSSGPARSGSSGTCNYATLPGPQNGGGYFNVTGLPVSTAAGAQTTVSFWMYWDGSNPRIAVGWLGYDVGMLGGYIGFNTNNSDVYGVSATGLANGWHHIAAVFTNGSVTSNKLYIDGALQTLTQAVGSPNLSTSVVTSTLNIGGYSASTDYRYSGRLDSVRVYTGLVTAAEVTADYNRTRACAGLVASYAFEGASAYTGAAGELTDTAGYLGGPYNGTAGGNPLPTKATASPARAGSAGTCGYTALNTIYNNWNWFTLSNLPLDTTTGAQNTVSFWMYWEGSDNVMPVSFPYYNLWFYNGAFGFNTYNTDIYGISTTGLVNGWHHVVAVFTNGGVTSNRLYIDGVARTLAQYIGAPTNSNAVASSTLRVGSWGAAAGSYNFTGRIDEMRIHNYGVSAAEAAALYAETHSCVGLHHLEIQHSSGSGLTCTPSTLTVRACQDAACTSLYTAGVTGTLTATGSGMTVNWPTGAGFSIASGSSSTTDDIHLVTAGSVAVGITGASPAPSNPTTCNFGSPSCTYTAADAGLLFDVPDHRAEAPYTINVTAVKKSDNSATCTPAFASVSKPVTFRCTYVNPTTGTRAVRIGSTALNSGNSATSACDAGGAAVTLAFNSSGQASTAVAYADAGRMTLTGTYTGSGSDAGLVMTGTDNFIAAPYTFAVTGPASGNIVAGNAFSGTVTARNWLGNAMPNFGRETSPEGATLSWVRTQPQGSGAVNGSFSGSLGAFSGGSASAGNLAWSEVGRGELSAVLASGSYLGSGIHVAGATNGQTSCSAQLGTCTLPTGVTAVVYYGDFGRFNTRTGVTGSIGCNNTNFGDPYYGVGTKACSYVVTSGASNAGSGSIGPFIPHHFDVTAAPACSSFSYAGQPFATTVTARNASNATTVNYDGSAGTSPNFAKATTLSDAPALGLGNWSGQALAATAFTAGVANPAPAYSFTSKRTAAQTLPVRAVDADGVSSSGYLEGTMPLRSGRLKLSNAFGSEKASLALPVQAQYWSGNAWVQNTADSCTAVPAAAVVRAAYLDGRGAATSAWTSTVSAIAISAGAGTLTLGAPSPSGTASTGSLDFALNLGATTTDQSCLAAHPASTGAALPWLRSQYGSSGGCAALWDRDPAARASFGIYVPETRKTVHVRELF